MASWGYPLVEVHRLLTVVASLVVEHGFWVFGLQQLRLSGSSAQAQQLWCMSLIALRYVAIFPHEVCGIFLHVSCIGRQNLYH